jgi:uncharacterized RDD family membrane protein YckC
VPTPGDRLRAWAVDSALVCLVWFLVVLALPRLEGSPLFSWTLEASGLLAGLVLDRPPPSRAPEFVLAVAAWPLLAVPYYVLTDGLLGASLGKRFLGLVVISWADGARCGPRRALLRTLFRAFDGIFFGLPAVIAMRSTAHGRRFGDLAAGTVVVRPVQGTPPTHEEERAEAAKRVAGAEGERRMREVLLPLARYGWDVFFGVAHPHFGDIGCLLVGPPGVFILDAKSDQGVVAEDPRTGALLRDGVPFEKDFRAQLAQQREHVLSSSRLLQTGEVPLQALLCFTRASLEQDARGDFPSDVLTLDLLLPYLRGSEGVVDAELRLAVSSELQRAYRIAPERPGSPGRPVNGTV